MHKIVVTVCIVCDSIGKQLTTAKVKSLVGAFNVFASV